MVHDGPGAGDDGAASEAAFFSHLFQDCARPRIQSAEVRPVGDLVAGLFKVLHQQALEFRLQLCDSRVYFFQALSVRDWQASAPLLEIGIDQFGQPLLRTLEGCGCSNGRDSREQFVILRDPILKV